MTRNLADYNTIPYGKELAATGRPLPQYFFEPLFKHPPIFTLLVTAAMRVFGPAITSGEYISLVSSVLMIPLIYLLGSLIFGRTVGLLSAFLFWIDPINMISSQKTWMDNTIAFFTLLTVVFFVLALKSNKNFYFILSGIASGLATNTKYTGVLITIVLVLFALLYRRDLFKRLTFNVGLILPLAMLLPWFFWNYKVYGWRLFSHMENNNDMDYILELISGNLWKVGLLGLLVYLLFLFLKRTKYEYRHSAPKVSPLTNTFIILFLLIFLHKAIIHSLQLFYFPATSWAQGLYSGAPTWFYFEHLIEFSPFYFFAFMALFIRDSTAPQEAAVLRLSAAVILIFFIAWGNYQSRYILSCLPFFIILAAAVIQKISFRLSEIRNFLPRTLGLFGFLLLVGYMLLKVTYINTYVSFPHDFCYF